MVTVSCCCDVSHVVLFYYFYIWFSFLWFSGQHYCSCMADLKRKNMENSINGDKQKTAQFSHWIRVIVKRRSLRPVLLLHNRPILPFFFIIYSFQKSDCGFWCNIYIYIYIYIYIKWERWRERKREEDISTYFLNIHTIYMFIQSVVNIYKHPSIYVWDENACI